MKHSITGQELFFPCNKWIQTSNESPSDPVVFEMAAVRPDLAPLEGNICYFVWLYVMFCKRLKVFIKLFGIVDNVSIDHQKRNTDSEDNVIMWIISFFSETMYCLTIVTGDLPRADTDAVIYCVITGDQGDTGKIVLRHSKHGGSLFRRAQVKTFLEYNSWNSQNLLKLRVLIRLMIEKYFTITQC
jgi:hypothetical protein